MRCANPVVVRQQARFLRHQFLQDGGLPFTDVAASRLIPSAEDVTSSSELGIIEIEVSIHFLESLFRQLGYCRLSEKIAYHVVSY